jgi:serine phosphatase RsbU (regulator of sigma subunit)
VDIARTAVDCDPEKVLEDRDARHVATPSAGAFESVGTLLMRESMTVDETGMSGPRSMLVVDDSALSRAWLMRILLEKGYSVSAMVDGPTAVESVRESEPDVVVVAEGMPGMSGRRLVEVLRNSGVCAGIVMLSGSDREDDEREALRAGVDDVLHRPCAADDVVRVVADADFRGRERRARVAREHHLDGEVRAAAQIQAALIPEPPALLNGWRLETGFLPASQVGGDTYDLFAGSDGTQVLVLADVSGKGVGAALLAGMAQTAIRAAFLRNDNPAEALSATNTVLFEPLARAGRFLTAFVAQLDQQTGSLTYADAGHGHTLLLSAAGRESTLPLRGQPLGLLPDVVYELGSVTLGAGDRFAVYSDGLVEGEGDPETARCVLVDAIRRGARPEELVADAADEDDRTMILLERTG